MWNWDSPVIAVSLQYHLQYLFCTAFLGGEGPTLVPESSARHLLHLVPRHGYRRPHQYPRVWSSSPPPEEKRARNVKTKKEITTFGILVFLGFFCAMPFSCLDMPTPASSKSSSVTITATENHAKKYAKTRKKQRSFRIPSVSRKITSSSRAWAWHPAASFRPLVSLHLPERRSSLLKEVWL